MKSKKQVWRGAAAFSVAAIALALSGCGKEQAAPQAGKPQVGVVTLKTQPVSLSTELPGRTSAFRVAEVRPQVNGIVQKRLFTEGGDVRAGQQLYQIDPSVYQATYDSAKAALARAQAQQRTAALLVDRYKPLVETRAVSRQTYDDAVSSRDQAAADVLSAKAALETARINLVYTKVLAPIDGIIGRSQVTEGALVTANQTGAIASVQQIDPIYVDVTQSSVQLLKLKRALATGQLQQADGAQAAKVTLMLEDGSVYDAPGKLEFSEVTVDPTTGSVTLRALFPNAKHELLPGMFVRARLAQGVAADGLLVPQRGVARSQRGLPTALVVNGENKVELRELVTDRALGDQWLVTKGLAAGDRVIVEGLQSVRPGVEVTAQEYQAGASAPAGQGGQAPAAK
ncbi:efflux RND transporter periplasmic adaptor subunit [Bordetella holmesii]|uniref:Acriflavine resistance protein A n=1 Tax=Bordetella holmesii CDC-H585-BH TaxID=1331206 RepID=A0A158M9G8_9BORD|nr:efflux RND transporter periplasmic adaptor subunit [Bordetella holmesii]AMD46697.1 hemolysin D [Bordetella holmesii H558]AMD47909.1 hemolysin D [Bordetella holmesii F627]AOB35596.1 efflux transporter periplasmic adaptor subunit [Bordetella holmesii]AUL19570.1 efflux transporter periplasmic adaptor subunit [Bordetella holmesii]AUL22912.1 efflux transporter periplasmic adaptor subunit [Bordetella holmesii]